MPVQRCTKNERPGWRYGSSGACYTYTPGDKNGSNRAKQKAFLQKAAVEASQKKAGKRVG